MRTFLVVPDELDGSDLWAQVTRANSPMHACKLVADYLAGGVNDEIQGFALTDEGVPGQDVWAVHEFTLPPANTLGVVAWDAVPTTLWAASRTQAAAA